MTPDVPSGGTIREGEPPYRSGSIPDAPSKQEPTPSRADGGGEVDIAQPVGVARRITGLVLLVYGAFLAVRMLWTYATYLPLFGEEVGLRCAVLFWFGCLLALTGYWLRYRSRIAGWAAIVSIPSFFGLFSFAVWLGL